MTLTLALAGFFYLFFIFSEQRFKFINKNVLTLELYEVRNTVGCKFAFCDHRLIVAMVTVQEPYFPKHVFHKSIQETLFYLGNMCLYVHGTALTMKIIF